ncbi:hypothetical protein [Paenibacillus tritici]|nr:hypothetical protein [Paenibacillus tritici]
MKDMFVFGWFDWIDWFVDWIGAIGFDWFHVLIGAIGSMIRLVD